MALLFHRTGEKTVNVFRQKSLCLDYEKSLGPSTTGLCISAKDTLKIKSLLIGVQGYSQMTLNFKLSNLDIVFRINYGLSVSTLVFLDSDMGLSYFDSFESVVTHIVQIAIVNPT